MELKIKFYIGDEIRRLSLPANCSYALLRSTLSKLCSLSQDFRIKYKDEEEDMVSITSDQEFQAAKTLAANPLLRLWIFGESTSLMQQVISSPVIQQLVPLAQAAQQASQQLIPLAQAAQEQIIPLVQKAGQKLMPFVQSAQQVAQEQIIPLAQQVGEQLLPFAKAAQDAVKQVQEAVQQVVQQAKAVSNPVPRNSNGDDELHSDKWDEQLLLLKDMGFCQEQDLLVYLLEQYNGRTERVIEALL